MVRVDALSKNCECCIQLFSQPTGFLECLTMKNVPRFLSISDALIMEVYRCSNKRYSRADTDNRYSISVRNRQLDLLWKIHPNYELRVANYAFNTHQTYFLLSIWLHIM